MNGWLLIIQITGEVNWLRSKNWKKWFQIHYKYGVKTIIGGFLIEVNTKIDILMLGMYMSDEKVGIYSISALCIEGYMQLYIVIQNLINPVIAQLMNKNKKDELKDKIKKIKQSICLISILVGSISIGMFGNLVRILTESNEYQASTVPFIILILAITIVSGYIPISNIFLMANLPGIQTRYMLINATINIAINALLIPKVGINGAAAATGVTLIISTIILKKWVNKYIKIDI